MSETTERKVEPILHIKEAEYERSIHAATVPIGTLPEDLTNQAYWAHVAQFLKPWGRIEAHCFDGTWFAEYLVTEVGRTFAKVTMLRKYALTTEDVALSQQTQANSDYYVKFRGAAKWSVIRSSDNAVMKEGMDKDDANAEMKKITATV